MQHPSYLATESIAADDLARVEVTAIGQCVSALGAGTPGH